MLLDGTIIAVKQLSSGSNQGKREFVNEIGMISSLRHPNLVRLHGCCVEHKQLLLVYEFMENNSLARALFGKFIYASKCRTLVIARNFFSITRDICGATSLIGFHTSHMGGYRTKKHFIFPVLISIS